MRAIHCICLTFLLAACASGQSPAPAPAPAHPATASELFADLSKETRPLWRQLYRSDLAGPSHCRGMAAYALGALMSDLTLACAARDEQQLRNVAQEVAAMEKALGIDSRMDALRHRVASLGAEGGWEEARKAVESACRRQLETLRDLRDDHLCALLEAGRWLRAWQISTHVVLERQLGAKENLALGDLRRLDSMLEALGGLKEDARAEDRCLRELPRRIQKIKKIWTQPAPDVYGRLRHTVELLGDCLNPLLATPPPSK